MAPSPRLHSQVAGATLTPHKCSIPVDALAARLLIRSTSGCGHRPPRKTGTPNRRRNRLYPRELRVGGARPAGDATPGKYRPCSALPLAAARLPAIAQGKRPAGPLLVGDLPPCLSNAGATAAARPQVVRAPQITWAPFFWTNQPLWPIPPIKAGKAGPPNKAGDFRQKTSTAAAR